jgi:5'-nucleotidase
LYELCPWRPDIVISGINGGLNAGINIHYSGTVGGAFEAAVSGILSFALSLEYQDEAPYDQAMSVLWPVMQPIIEQHRQASGERSSPLVELDRPPSSHLIYNINLPTIALRQSCPVSVVPMESRRNGIEFNSGHCPKNRRYYWATHDLLPEQPDPPTDVFALRQGHITVTPLEINMTCDAHLHRLRERLQGIERRSSGDGEHNTNAAPSGSRAPDDAGSAVGGPAAASDEETVDDGPRYSRL